MINVTNYGAACCVIESNGARILTDPWFTDGIYLGAWRREHYIPDPIAVIGPVDYVWVSHLHEDHLDHDFLRAYFTVYPTARLWVGQHCPHLIRMTKEFSPVIAPHISLLSGATAWSLPNDGYDGDINIDSALVVTDASSAVVNMNDCPYDDAQIAAINQRTPGRHVTALLPYSGAGPWPQCYTMTKIEQWAEAQKKKEQFVGQFIRYKAALRADVAVPFSAGYQLDGPLAHLNRYRGIPEPSEVAGATPLPVVGASAATRTWGGFHWDQSPMPTNDEIELLIMKASARAPRVDGEPLTIELDWHIGSDYIDCTYAPAKRSHETICLDPRLLHGLLTRKYHWNSLEISSALQITRHGKDYDHRVFSYLVRFHAGITGSPSSHHESASSLPPAQPG